MFSITYEDKKAKGKLPRLPFEQMKDAALGAEYELNVVIATGALMQELNRTHRNKNYPTDILSFPYSTTHGEIFLNLEETAKTAKEFKKPFKDFIGFLFIHGLIHLKGYDHGSKMEYEEQRIRSQFGF